MMNGAVKVREGWKVVDKFVPLMRNMKKIGKGGYADEATFKARELTQRLCLEDWCTEITLLSMFCYEWWWN